MGKPILHNYPATVHVVRQIVAKHVGVEERSIAERHNDVVLLQLTQSGGGVRGIEEVHGGDTGFGLDFRLKLSRRTCISEHDKHLELARSRGRRCCWCENPDGVLATLAAVWLCQCERNHAHGRQQEHVNGRSKKISFLLHFALQHFPTGKKKTSSHITPLNDGNKATMLLV